MSCSMPSSRNRRVPVRPVLTLRSCVPSAMAASRPNESVCMKGVPFTIPTSAARRVACESAEKASSKASGIPSVRA